MAKAFVDKVDQWFLERSLELSDVDADLPQIVELTINKLKSSLFLNDSDSVNLPTSFDLVSTTMNEYMNSPFRKEIRDKLEICLDMSKELAPFPQEPISINQFSGCIKDMSDWVMVHSKSRELSPT